MPALSTPSTETTLPSGSLDEAGARIAGLLSDIRDDAEDRRPSNGTPEPSTPKPKPSAETQQAPAAPDAEESPTPEPASDESEQAEDPPESNEPPERETDQPKTYRVKINGEEVEVTEAELLKGYSREKDYTAKSQKLAELRREFEDKELAAVRTERQQYGEYLGQLKQAITALNPVEPDWEALRTQSTPDVFQERWIAWHAHTKRVGEIEAEQAKVRAAQQADAEQGFAKHVAAEQQRLVEALPEMADPEKGKALRVGLGTYAQSLGFTAKDLEAVTDHRLVVLLHKAMQFDQAATNAPKLENRLKTVLKASEPGAKPSLQKPDALKAAQARLRQSGRVEDAADAIAHLI